MAAAESSKSSSPSLSSRDEFAALDEAIWRDSYADNLLRPAEARHEDLLWRVAPIPAARTEPDLLRETPRRLRRQWAEEFVARHFGALFIAAVVVGWILLEAGILPPLDIGSWEAQR